METKAVFQKEHPNNAAFATLRRIVLWILLFGAVGTWFELLLLEHTEGFWQLVPLILIAVSLLTVAWHYMSRGMASMLALRATMALVGISGFVGVWLHYRGNVEFELEMYPGLSGFGLFWEAMKGATPALAPGTMTLLGLLGLAYTYGLSTRKQSNESAKQRELDMKAFKAFLFVSVAAVSCGALFVVPVEAQVGRSQASIDPNIATEQQLLALPHLNATTVKSIMERRPFLTMTQLNAVLSPSLNKQQLTELYGKMFVHINLNTATDEEILLIPGLGNRMLHEFKEYRPYLAMAQFRREIGKYVDDKELARLEQYVFVPINLNTATDADILTIPGMGNRMLHEFKEYRPYRSIEQFRREIGKYVNDREVARFERYVTLN
jgi:DNA uptake protein ComE-like DNA-binding protein